MICHNCYKYGHTGTRCEQAKVCRKCGGTDLSIDNCENNSMCPHCAGNHFAGIRECGAEQRERKIKEVQTNERVGRRRAIQILSGEEESPANKSIKVPNPL